MGSLGHQPPGQNLSHHSGGAETARAQGVELRTHARRNNPGDEANRVMRSILRLFRRPRIRTELAQEVESHLEERTAELMESGMPKKEAREQASREFGNPLLIMDAGSDVWGGGHTLDRLLQ